MRCGNIRLLWSVDAPEVNFDRTPLRGVPPCLHAAFGGGVVDSMLRCLQWCHGFLEEVAALAGSPLVVHVTGSGKASTTSAFDPPVHPRQRGRGLKEAVLLTFPKEAFPYSNRTSRGLDLDHTTAYQPSSRDPHIRLENLAPPSHRPHRAKTAGLWKCQQPLTGQLVWTSPLGFRYTINKDGTRRLE